MTHARYMNLYNLSAYGEGATAAERGQLVLTNPHQPGTDNYYAWKLGWEAADDQMTAACFTDEDDR